MKTKLFIAALWLTMMSPLFIYSQKGKPVEPAPGNGNANAELEREFATWHKIYRNCLAYNDLATATTAVHAMLALKPESENWKDSLAIIFFQRGAYEQSMRVGKDILEKTPNDTAVLELVSVSEQSLGLLKEALEDYERLYKMAGNLHHLYEIATIQYQLKRFGECEISAAQIIAGEGADRMQVSIITGNNEQQMVPLKAAAVNLRGVLAMEISKWTEAKAFFDQALQMFPEFALAKGNKEYCDKQLAGGN